MELGSGPQQAAMALADAAQGRPLFEATLVRDIPVETCMEIALVFCALAARAAQTSPRVVCDSLYREAPSDEDWEWHFLPHLETIARGG